MKGEAALKKYGEKANNGVVEVELNPGDTTPEKDLQLISNESKEKPLVVINGNIVKHGSVEDLDPDDIATINVVKGQAAQTKYGDKGANGVVEVIMKAGKTYQPNELDTVITFYPETFEETTMIKHRNHSHMIRDTVIVYDPETYIGTSKIIEREANRKDPIDVTMTYAKDKIKLTSNTAVWTELYFKIKDGKTQIIDYYGLSDDINSKAPFSFEIVKSGDDFIFRNNHGFDWTEMETNCNKWVYSNTEIKKDRIEINCF